jgi:hypothetical protein
MTPTATVVKTLEANDMLVHMAWTASPTKTF